MLDAAMTQQLRSHFTKIDRPVRLVASLDASEASRELASLLEEVAGLCEQIHLERDGTDERRPSVAVVSAETGERVRFAGLPLGHEFSSLVLAILQVGGHPPVLSEDLLAQARTIERELNFETFFSQSCQNCPVVVQALNALSVLNPNVSHVAIDGGSFRDEVSSREVLAVPTVFLNGEPFAQGRMDLEQILRQLGTTSNEARVAELDARAPYDVLVVGAGPAGAAAAIYSARKGLRTGLLAERVGGQVLDTDAIENLISVVATTGPTLAANLESHVASYDVDVITGERAARLVPGDVPGDEARVELERGASLRARSVVVATGARWRRLGVPGEQELLNRGVTFCPHCDGPLFKARRVAVIGGGNSGVEAAIDLANVVAHVTLIEFDDQLRADEVLQRKLRSLPNVDVLLGTETTQILGESSMTGLLHRRRGESETHQLNVEGVFVQIGLVPNTEWLEGTLALSARGELLIDERGATSAPGVFGAGDCTNVPFKQIVVALGAGSTAALSAFDYLIRSSAPAEDAAVAGVASVSR